MRTTSAPPDDCRILNACISNRFPSHQKIGAPRPRSVKICPLRPVSNRRIHLNPKTFPGQARFIGVSFDRGRCPRDNCHSTTNAVEDPMRKNAYGIIMPALLALALGACTSSHDRHNKNLEPATANTTSPANSPAVQSSSGPGIDLNCVVDHLQNPPESFHYLYKKDSSSPVHQE